MDPKRLLRHLFTTHWRLRAAFPRRSILAIEAAVHASHQAHVGQVRFAVEGALHITPLMKGTSARERAIDVFSALRIWDTEYNNGILIYVLLADRAVEIVADRGIHARVQSSEWEAICHAMEVAFKRRAYEAGALRGIEQVTELLKMHFPLHRPPRDELPSSPVIM
ncbi:TPM domain-containing protein [Burkholderia pseudomultivorans]|uniref:TPM domain-containing protein n=1 Tax=Burkholderia pseudomultivorans TaxID=1207504 RepID=UPI00188E7B65|nr:TPM domain-containing protein [Burkholderia pseudomultivorans]MBF5008707.1 TPM domain-containing protein [Burkholderia pseudomultivorans]